MKRNRQTLEAALNDLDRQHLRRRRRTVEGFAAADAATEVIVDGRSLVNFCSNDYLGLSRHPEVALAMSEAALRYGSGSGASHLVTGHGAEHAALEEELAEFTGRERALLFSTGYMANLAAITTFVDRGDLVLLDRLSHASLIDGGLLSQAKFARYAHSDATAAARELTRFNAAAGGKKADRAMRADAGATAERSGAGHASAINVERSLPHPDGIASFGKTVIPEPRSQSHGPAPRPLEQPSGMHASFSELGAQARTRDTSSGTGTRAARSTYESGGSAMIVTDGVFSMDGDLAPLPELAELAKAHEAWLVVDDAHGIGVLGANGRGTLEHFGLASDSVPLLAGTLGKAFGSFGAFVAGDADVVELLVQRARTYIYTTALPQPVAAATRAALKVMQRETWRRERVLALTQRFRAAARQVGLPLAESPTPIQPIVLGDADVALAASQSLFDAGFWVSAIRPPTVPRGSARLRVTFSADHTEAQVDALVDALLSAVGTVHRGTAPQTTSTDTHRTTRSTQDGSRHSEPAHPQPAPLDQAQPATADNVRDGAIDGLREGPRGGEKS